MGASPSTKIQERREEENQKIVEQENERQPFETKEIIKEDENNFDDIFISNASEPTYY